MYIQELWRYPVKSLAGEQLQEVELTLHGMLGDRLARQWNCCSGAGSVPGDDFSTQRRAGSVWCSNST